MPPIYLSRDKIQFDFVMSKTGGGKENGRMEDENKERKLPEWMMASGSVDGEEWGAGKKEKAGPNTPKKGGGGVKATAKAKATAKMVEEDEEDGGTPEKSK